MLLNRMEVSKDGRTSYERSKGKKAKELEYEFCEGIWWRTKVVKPLLKKLEIMWQDGVYLGVKATTGEVIVGTAEGIFRTRTVRKKPKEDRWDVKHLDMIGGVPWRKQNGDEATDGERLPMELRPDRAEQVSTELEKKSCLRRSPQKVSRSRRKIWTRTGIRKGVEVARLSLEEIVLRRTWRVAGRGLRKR